MAEGAMVDDRRVELTGGTRVFVSPHDPDHVFFAFGAAFDGYGTDIFRSTDGLRSLAVSHFDDFYEVFAMAFGPSGTDVVFVGASSDFPSTLRHRKFRTVCAVLCRITADGTGKTQWDEGLDLATRVPPGAIKVR